MDFQIDAFFNPHLAPGARRIDAVFSVKALAQAQEASLLGKAVCLIIDHSGSMSGEKILAAKLAARRGLDLLPEDAWFSVVIFDDQAQALVPMGPATRERKAAAHRAIQNIEANGGTRMSSALRVAKEQFQSAQGRAKAAYLLTDGENDTNDSRPLGAAIDDCSGVFQCDCRGLGAQWRPDDLRRIAGGLGGMAEACVESERLEADFMSFLGRAMGRVASDIRLRVWTPKVAKTVGVKQMSPEILDLFGKSRRIDEKTVEFPLGAWGAEQRDYHVAIELPPGSAGDEMMACRASLVLLDNGVEKVFSAPNVVAVWTNDASLTTRIHAQVAHYTGQEELANAIAEGLGALAASRADEATRQLGRAAKIAHASGNEEATARLRKVVDIVDAPAGTVRIRAGFTQGDALELDIGGTRTVRRRPASEAAPAK